MPLLTESWLPCTVPSLLPPCPALPSLVQTQAFSPKVKKSNGEEHSWKTGNWEHRQITTSPLNLSCPLSPPHCQALLHKPSPILPRGRWIRIMALGSRERQLKAKFRQVIWTRARLVQHFPKTDNHEHWYGSKYTSIGLYFSTYLVLSCLVGG